ncbi:MAG: asparagine--tRNA ligase [Mycoplasmataceae bacterium]|nr:asparagine--tRNA ligase [Mycoplasmataceae bacterium]
MTIKELFKNKTEKTIKLKGWVLSNRGNEKIRFITVNDGSTFSGVQVVLKGEQASEFDSVRIGASICVKGEVKLTPDAKQDFEIISETFKLLKNTDEDFPIQKHGMSREFLREIPHLRHRTNLFRASMRIRSTLFLELHKYFDEKGFLNVASPIITGSDGEGAGEMFVIDDELEAPFFGKKANLGVTGQLHAEAYSNGFGKVYSFNPIFRAEHSNTQKHAAEFWMLEPEVAFYSMNDGIELADNMLKVVIANTIKKHPQEFEFLNQFVDKTLMERLNEFVSKGIQTITYSDAIIKLQKVADKFENSKIEFGIDLATEHEKYIASEIFNGPVAVTDYPKDIKAFYMKANDDNKTVAAFDILVPGIGELIGGSERETDYQKLDKRVEEMNIKKEEIQWYMDLRRFGQSQSTGFGLGFERLVMYVTGVENIRDTIPFPRTTKSLKM